MRLERIDIVDFKNIAGAELEFSPGVNCLVGLNGMGKSNLLEAIHFLSMARPLRPMPETALIRHGAEMTVVKGSYLTEAGTEEDVSCGIVRGKGKTLKHNGKDYGKMSDHIGRFPIVTVTPADTELVGGSAEVRRRLVDMVISQADASYLSRLIRYNKSLETRNRMLRAGMRDRMLFESVETVMSEAAESIHSARKSWVEGLEEDFERYYTAISGGVEKASIGYRSVLGERPMAEVFESTRARDQQLGFTSSGIHRDDLEMRLDEWHVRRTGSQGQVKSYTLALRLAVYDYLRRQGGERPLLLLDDIFDKLDAGRVARIMTEVSRGGNFGQIFITDTNREHIDETVAGIGGESLLLEVANGKFSKIG